MKHTFESIGLVLAASLLWVGCAAVHPKAYSSGDAPTQLLVREADGVRIGVDVVLDGSRSHRYFGTDALAKGIVPVFVRVENTSGTGSVLVEKENFTMTLTNAVDGQSPIGGSVDNKPSSGAQALAAGGLLLLSGPALIAGSIMVSTADAVRYAFVEKELRNQSLGPGRSVEGFVYYVRQDKKRPLTDLSLSIPVRNLQTDQLMVLQFTVKNENAKRP